MWFLDLRLGAMVRLTKRKPLVKKKMETIKGRSGDEGLQALRSAGSNNTGVKYVLWKAVLDASTCLRHAQKSAETDSDPAVARSRHDIRYPDPQRIYLILLEI